MVIWSELPVCTVFTTVTIASLHNQSVHKNMCFGCCIQRTSTAPWYGAHSTAVAGVFCSLCPVPFGALLYPLEPYYTLRSPTIPFGALLYTLEPYYTLWSPHKPFGALLYVPFGAFILDLHILLVSIDIPFYTISPLFPVLLTFCISQ